MNQKTRLLHCYKTTSEQHLANLFYISQLTFSRIFITRCNFMYLKLGRLNIWPCRKLFDETMPEDFKARYPSTKVIINCTEIRCEMPRSLLLNSELFSSYKHHTTSHRDQQESHPRGLSHLLNSCTQAAYQKGKWLSAVFFYTSLFLNGTL